MSGRGTRPAPPGRGSAHRRNGFFVIRPGEGYEYVLNLIPAARALAALGSRSVSLDNALDLDLDGWIGLAVATLTGGGGAALLLHLLAPARRSS